MKKENNKTIRASGQPCPSCGSSDALTVYEDNHSFCFSCKRFTKDVDNTSDRMYNIRKKERKETDSLKKEFVDRRGITRQTHAFFNVKTLINEDGEKEYTEYPYGECFIVRSEKEKAFIFKGDSSKSSLFGKEKFAPGQSSTITVTEGADDAMSVYQMFGSKYPVVSVKSASSAKKECERDFKYLNAFDKIYLCFDNDEPGQKALKEVASLFDPNKIYHVKLGRFKDANDYLKNNSEKEFTACWWSAKKFLPKGIISSWKDIEDSLNSQDSKPLCNYPFPSLQEMTYGIFSSKFILFTAQEKVGKTEVFRAIEYHILKNTEYNLGIIHLEEKEKRSIQGLIGYEVKKPVHTPDTDVSKEEQLKIYKSMTKRDDRLYFYTHFGSEDPGVILDAIRYLVMVCKCKFIFLDHISMVVSGFDEGDERRKLDFISTKLAMLTRELDFTLFAISHVNDDGQTRGSRYISKVADLIISLKRDIEASSFEERNKTYLTIKGNRDFGKSGPAGILVFDPETFTLSEQKKDEDEELERFKIPKIPFEGGRAEHRRSDEEGFDSTSSQEVVVSSL